MGVWCGSGRLCLYGSVAGRNQFRFFVVVWGTFVFEEVVTQGESIALPVKGLKVTGPLPKIRASVDALERVPGVEELLA